MRELVELGPDGQRLRSLQDILEEDFRAMDAAERAVRTDQADGAYFRAWAGQVQSRGHAGVLADAAGDDGADELERLRCIAAVDRYLRDGGSYVDLDRRLADEAPSLRSQRFTMERQQRERAEAQAARQVHGSELDGLRQEVTHLRSLLAAHGIRDGW